MIMEPVQLIKKPAQGTKPITVLLVDDHPVVRNSYRRLLDNTADMQVVAEADDGESACSLYAKFKPTVVTLDLGMPGMGGLEAIRRLKAIDPAVRVLIFSMHDSDTLVMRSFEAGATGYLTKQGGMGQMAEAVRCVAQGKSYIDTQHVSELATRQVTMRSRNPLDALSKRETELFHLFAEGKSVQQIADSLGISPKTVRVHHTNIMNKLGISNAAQLVRLAIHMNLLPP